MKIHYVRYRELYDEWQIATLLSSGWNLFVLLLVLLLKAVVHGELYREIKRKFNCILAERIIKQLHVEIRIDQDVFDKQKVCYNL